MNEALSTKQGLNNEPFLLLTRKRKSDRTVMSDGGQNKTFALYIFLCGYFTDAPLSSAHV
jgi:hypothetical protein